MIRQKEISDKATEWDVPPETVEKDYTIGHFLSAFYSFEEYKTLFVFKGGTCLRKCYFPDYRFSEDLDFTVTNPDFEINQNLIKMIADKCTHDSGILFGDIEIKSKTIHDNALNIKEFRIPFWGANHSKSSFIPPQHRWTTKIELDFSNSDKIYTPIEFKMISHQFSDDLSLQNRIPVYSLQEILIEKIRSFKQRNHKSPRDYFDVWYIIQHVEFENWDEISALLKEKCIEKKVVLNPDIFNDIDIKSKIQKSWKTSLKKQLRNLPEFETVWFYLKENLFQKLKLQ
jgi:predicted nucleotidyltransferase component of viral defense system